MAIVNKIVIVGGGSAGWMSAATLKHHLPEKEVIVIESPNIPTVGVGESTIGQINAWLHDLDIKDDEWMPHCDASYKLSIKFTDFYMEDSGGFHYPFGLPHIEGTIYGINDWYFKKSLFPDTPNTDYAETYYPAVALSESNKITKNENNELPTWRFDNDTAYHFDAAKFGIWLRDKYCKPRGVKHIPAEVTVIHTDDSGIKELMLSNGDSITADLFIDCTGFKALLIDKTLKVPFNKLDNILPNDSAWATRVPYQNKEAELEPYTNCTAIENGWVWNIPLWSRIGTGYVYSSKFVSDEDALQEFKDYLINRREFKIPKEIVDTLEFKKIPMRVGLHDKVYYKNVCAIGLAAGFIEPLESNGLFTAHEFLTKLAKTLRRGSISQWDKDSFNSSVKKDFYSFAQFVSLHYGLSQRSKTPYWKAVSERSFLNGTGIPDVDKNYEDFIFKRMHRMSYDFDLGGMNCIAPGMGFFPIDESAIKRSIYLNKHDSLLMLMDGVFKQWDENKANWKKVVDSSPTLYQFLKDNYYTDVS